MTSDPAAIKATIGRTIMRPGPNTSGARLVTLILPPTHRLWFYADTVVGIFRRIEFPHPKSLATCGITCGGKSRRRVTSGVSQPNHDELKGQIEPRIVRNVVQRRRGASLSHHA